MNLNMPKCLHHKLKCIDLISQNAQKYYNLQPQAKIVIALVKIFKSQVQMCRTQAKMLRS